MAAFSVVTDVCLPDALQPVNVEEIIAVTMDLGQGKDVLEEVRDRALATGALRAHVVDARDLYLRDYILRGLRAGMLWHRGASMASALAVPLIAEKLVEIARINGEAFKSVADKFGNTFDAGRRELTGRGVPTKRGGPKWAASTIKRLIANEKHHAEVHQGGAAGPGQAQPELPAP